MQEKKFRKFVILSPPNVGEMVLLEILSNGYWEVIGSYRSIFSLIIFFTLERE